MSPIQFRVTIDHQFVPALREASQAGGTEALLAAARSRVEEATYLGREQGRILADVPGSFPEHTAMLQPEYWQEVEAISDYIRARLSESVDYVTRYLPTSEQADYRFVVHLVPGFATNFGPTEGHQVYSIRGGALPEEAYLFLLHVYYHELTNLFNTPLSRRASAAPRNADLFKHYLLTLVRNEGIGNYIVLDRLAEFQAAHQGYAYRYFKYAERIGDDAAHSRAMEALRGIMTRLNEANFRSLIGRITEMLKDERLPIINLVGISMARGIAAHYGERTLLDSASAEPQAFFRLFLDTADPLAAALREAGETQHFTTIPDC